MSNVPTAGALGATELSRLLEIGDVLIPALETLPKFTDTPRIEATVQRVMSYRPDLIDDVRRGVASCLGEPAMEAARRMHDQDKATLSAIGLVLSAAYLMTPEIRDVIGYPGQERVERQQNDATEIPTHHMLADVLARGTICRRTP